MQRGIPIRQGAFGLAIVLLGATSMAAEDATYEERVTVTASRTEVSPTDTGNSVTILDREEIEARQSMTIGDLLRGVAGIAVSRGGGVGSLTQIRVRGSEANHVLVMIDGVPVNDAFAGDELPLELVTPYDIERIEIVRGPQSGLWGADAVAGVVNVITRPASAAGMPETAAEAGSFGTVRGAGRVGFGGDHARFELGGSAYDQRGTNISRSGGEEDGSANATADLHFRWNRPDGPWSLDVVGRHTDAEADYDGIDFVATGLPTDERRTTDTRLSLVQAVGRRHGAASAWRHEARAALAVSDTRSRVDGAFDGSTAIDKAELALQSSVDLPGSGGSRERRLTFAVEHERRSFEQRGLATPFGDPNQDRELDSTGGVVELRLGRRETWSAALSLRHDRHSDFHDATTWRGAFSWTLPGDGRTRLRAATGTGQKPPTFIERFGFFSDQFVGNPSLEPERSRGWEVGLDREIGQRSRVGLTWFDSRLTDEINGFVFDPLSGLFTARNEPGASDRQGLELTCSGALGPRTHVSASYTYTDARQPDGLGGTDEELRRPRHLAHLHVRHAFSRVPLHLSVDVARTGSQTDVWYPPFPQPSEVVRLDPWVRVDLAASYRLAGRVELTARVENALDEDYEEVYGYATPGIGGWIGLRWRAGS